MMDSHRTTLPLNAQPVSTAQGMILRLPIRAEQVTISKEAVVYERVVVRRASVPEVASARSEIQREELRHTARGDTEVVDTRRV